MKTFSQRKGLKSLSEIIQTNSMSTELRTSLWNALDEALWSTPGYVGNKTRTDRSIDPFSRALWFHHFKKSVDSRPILAYQILDEIRRHFFKCQWFEVYDFLEFVVLYYKRPKPRLAEFLNQFLERELSGYRFVRGHLTDITSTEEREMLESVFADSQFTGVTAHLERALELYANGHLH
jgi:hypothetical protein